MNWVCRLLLIFILVLQGCSSFSTQDPRDLEQHWQDQKVEMDIAGLANSRQFTRSISANSISLNGKVLLIGQATSAAAKTQFGQQVKHIDNVKDLYNQLEVRPLLSVGDISYDAWLTTKVKSQLIASKQLTGAVIQVISEGGQVYLLGYVTPRQKEIAINIARNINGVKKVVTLFEPSQSR
ncbi:BON domain-containing protein [Photobacterium angustum]|uniref:BON domain-containing protein n=1 Tax=Photobacterium angustum TaxID=661 RepID=UPI0005E67882|nr:BON domain-containing protein [Photobacterium angustum]KJG01192.1 hemolysin [Photobacterium angustum]PSV67556.1 BON domain-containing protein [Photobacterium angustum]